MNNLKKIREEMGMTISKLSQLSGISRETIYRLEDESIQKANTQTLIALADALGVSLADFFAQ